MICSDFFPENNVVAELVATLQYKLDPRAQYTRITSKVEQIRAKPDDHAPELLGYYYDLVILCTEIQSPDTALKWHEKALALRNAMGVTEPEPEAIVLKLAFCYSMLNDQEACILFDISAASVLWYAAR